MAEQVARACRDRGERAVLRTRPRDHPHAEDRDGAEQRGARQDEGPGARRSHADHDGRQARPRDPAHVVRQGIGGVCAALVGESIGHEARQAAEEERRRRARDDEGDDDHPEREAAEKGAQREGDRRDQTGCRDPPPRMPRTIENDPHQRRHDHAGRERRRDQPPADRDIVQALHGEDRQHDPRARPGDAQRDRRAQVACGTHCCATAAAASRPGPRRPALR